MTVEVEVQIMKSIKLLISNDDVDGFLEDLKDLFTNRQPAMNLEPHLSQAKSIFGTLHKIWLEVNQQL